MTTAGAVKQPRTAPRRQEWRALRLFLKGHTPQKVAALLYPHVGGPKLMSMQEYVWAEMRADIRRIIDEIVQLRKDLKAALRRIKQLEAKVARLEQANTKLREKKAPRGWARGGSKVDDVKRAARAAHEAAYGQKPTVKQVNEYVKSPGARERLLSLFGLG
jgi:TolA-binding protein